MLGLGCKEREKIQMNRKNTVIAAIAMALIGGGVVPGALAQDDELVFEVAPKHISSPTRYARYRKEQRSLMYFWHAAFASRG